MCIRDRYDVSVMMILRLTSATVFTAPSDASTPTILSIRPKYFMGSSPFSVFAESNANDYLICSAIVLGMNQSHNILHPALLIGDFVSSTLLLRWPIINVPSKVDLSVSEFLVFA